MLAHQLVEQNVLSLQLLLARPLCRKSGTWCEACYVGPMSCSWSLSACGLRFGCLSQMREAASDCQLVNPASSRTGRRFGAECPWERERERERERDRETERQRDRETERQRDRETERQRDRETERQRDRETERQRDRETERQRDRETEKERTQKDEKRWKTMKKDEKRWKKMKKGYHPKL